MEGLENLDMQRFLIGFASASHHVESKLDNDWSTWLEKNAQRLADNPVFSVNQDFIPESHKKKKRLRSNYLLKNIIDHQRDYLLDFDLMKDLGCNAYRFSLEWSRIEPERGVFSQSAIGYYLKYIHDLRRRNIEPVVTLWHFTLPNWVSDLGGWENRATIGYFMDFVKKVEKVFSPYVRFWITVNEPEVYAAECYLVGKKLVMKKNVILYNRVLYNLLDAHKYAFKYIKQKNKHALISIAKHYTYFALEGFCSYIFTPVKCVAQFFQNDRILARVQPYCDFLGINHYITVHIGIPRNRNKVSYVAPFAFIDHSGGSNELGWGHAPENLFNVLLELKKYNKPILLTESGTAGDSNLQSDFLIKSFKAVKKAQDEGMKIIGYLYFTFFDSFEWTDGFAAPFGLVRLNFKTRKRLLKKSGLIFKKIAQLIFNLY